jgi:hypothetical protein
MKALVDRGQLRPLLDATFPLEQVADAQRKLATGGIKGKSSSASDELRCGRGAATGYDASPRLALAPATESTQARAEVALRNRSELWLGAARIPAPNGARLDRGAASADRAGHARCKSGAWPDCYPPSGVLRRRC